MHLMLTVLVEPEHAGSEAKRQERVDQLMEPYGDLFEVPPYEADCWEDEHDEECCNGTLTVWTTLNPYPTWDWYQFVGPDSPRGGDLIAGEWPSFALLLPGGGWSDWDTFYGRTVHFHEDVPEWENAFRATVRSYTERRYVPVLVDYHC
ncbi:MAG: hypothetical protein F4X26_05030 [Chloroflexi bacterium]|nr:hypothetical protein [Chloroflexota bacterium]MYD65333.1 hypothetical protein [Chloroflexota bacterium]